ncbi:nuclear transport factor 2 family protein [Aliiglaciecola litoralis]|uniref:Nuclear transport factor 2 family protein n=1 Tax=Aliiglaciecola litoralis TaxID=582857 RepID=A0ABN1LPK3_9ALTE
MNSKLVAIVMGLLLTLNNAYAEDQTAEVERVLDLLHESASKAQMQPYFSLFAEHGVFIGTDASERWNKEAFAAFAKPYFDSGKGWTYVPLKRNVSFSKSGKVAWFDEILQHKTYGECRGTGVLELGEAGWQLTQYHLTFPIPNAIAADITQQIRAHKKAQ